MKAFEKIYLNNFKPALRDEDQVIFEFLYNSRKKQEKIRSYLSNQKVDYRQYIRKEKELLRQILKFDLKKVLVYKILDNLKSHHNENDKGVIYDTSNLTYIENYRSGKALKEAKSLLSKEVRELPKQLDLFFRNPNAYKEIINRPFFHMFKITKLFHNEYKKKTYS